MLMHEGKFSSSSSSPAKFLSDDLISVSLSIIQSYPLEVPEAASPSFLFITGIA